jgi:hypothetical protein
MGKPRDDKDAAQDMARDLTDLAGQLASLKGEANACLRAPNYNTLKLRLESEHDAATEAAALWRLEMEGEAESGETAPLKYRLISPPLWTSATR